MGRLVYSMITSLDGHVADAQGRFDWAEPDEELHAFINARSRSIGTYLYGRRMYETMVFWETAQGDPDEPAVFQEFAEIWRAADKVVHSTTLADVSSARTRLVRTFDPQAVRALKESSERDVSVDGPHLAAHALRAGLVDAVEVYVAPVVVGGGTRFYPDGVRLDLEPAGERRFGNGVLLLQYAVRR